MKRMFFVSVLIVVLCTASFARKFVAEGKTHTAVGNYKIEAADNPVRLMGKELKAYVITYDNSNLEVTVAVDRTRKGITYYVLSPALSVKYMCNGTYFGVYRLNGELEADGYRTANSAVNNGEYYHQRVISTGQGCELDHSKLIAAYFPLLLNNAGNAIAER